MIELSAKSEGSAGAGAEFTVQVIGNSKEVLMALACIFNGVAGSMGMDRHKLLLLTHKMAKNGAFTIENLDKK